MARLACAVMIGERAIQSVTLMRRHIQRKMKLRKLKKKIKKNKKGFELLKNAVVPKSLNQPDKKISFLKRYLARKRIKSGP